MSSTGANNASLRKKVIACDELFLKKCQLGEGAEAVGQKTIAVGRNAVAQADNSIMIGNGTASVAGSLVIANGAGVQLIYVTPDVNVTQTTNNNTAVTCSGTKGKITMSGIIAAGAGHEFVVTNTYVQATSKVFLSVVGTTATSVATREALTINVKSIGSGSYSLQVFNTDGGDTTAAPVIQYLILP